MKYLVALLPSPIKIRILRIMGARIGKNCYIGVSIVNAKDLDIGDNVYIGHCCLLWRLRCLRLESGSRLEFANWVTGAGIGQFSLGRNSAVQRFHFFESSSDISVGSNTIIAGRNSTFFSHGIAPDDLDVKRSISIGDWCYVGSDCRFVPGARLPNHTFVGMGCVVTKAFTESYTLITGCPATVKKVLEPNAAYFDRPYMPHAHHHPDYVG
jgi:acetyltransferase-like isoleucine patch superfamily enzyme